MAYQRHQSGISMAAYQRNDAIKYGIEKKKKRLAWRGSSESVSK